MISDDCNHLVPLYHSHSLFFDNLLIQFLKPLFLRLNLGVRVGLFQLYFPDYDHSPCKVITLVVNTQLFPHVRQVPFTLHMHPKQRLHFYDQLIILLVLK
jgi:hypothetical protein